jgi:ribonucleoside-diphosphate reductase alpha chain
MTINIDKKIVSWKIDGKFSTFKDNNAVKRPKELPCNIHQVKIKGESWAIIVGMLEGKPYEIFGGLSKFIEIPKKYKDGILIKNGKVNGVSKYNLVVGKDDDQFTIKDVVSVFENTTQGSFTRIISLSLRHGVAVNFIVEQLLKDQHSDVTSFSKVIARVLKTYIPEGTKSNLVCDSCQSTNVVFVGGCLTCLDGCGSKCG